jgi:hypothetical protein
MDTIQYPMIIWSVVVKYMPVLSSEIDVLLETEESNTL